jgi:hypothetical protein
MKYLEANTEIYLSEKGHNGFFYPASERETTIVKCDVTRLSWVGGNNFIPVLIQASAIYAYGKNNLYLPVWVDKNNLLDYDDLPQNPPV